MAAKFEPDSKSVFLNVDRQGSKLGLACSLQLLPGHHHEIVVLEAKDWRLEHTLSDFKGRDPLIHYNRCDDFDHVFARPRHRSVIARSSGSSQRRSNPQTHRGHHQTPFESNDRFRASAFRAISEAATELAVDAGYIVP